MGDGLRPRRPAPPRRETSLGDLSYPGAASRIFFGGRAGAPVPPPLLPPPGPARDAPAWWAVPPGRVLARGLLPGDTNLPPDRPADVERSSPWIPIRARTGVDGPRRPADLAGAATGL